MPVAIANEGEEKGKTIRVDLYYGFRDEGGPRDRHQIYFDIVNDDIDDAIEVLKECFEDTVSELINCMEDEDYDDISTN